MSVLAIPQTEAIGSVGSTGSVADVGSWSQRAVTTKSQKKSPRQRQTKRTVVVILAGLTIALLAGCALENREYQIKHRPPMQAEVTIRPSVTEQLNFVQQFICGGNRQCTKDVLWAFTEGKGMPSQWFEALNCCSNDLSDQLDIINFFRHFDPNNPDCLGLNVEYPPRGGRDWVWYANPENGRCWNWNLN